jgi:hypothetical protein
MDFLASAPLVKHKKTGTKWLVWSNTPDRVQLENYHNERKLIVTRERFEKNYVPVEAS